MGKITGFMEFSQKFPAILPAAERVSNSKEFISLYTTEELTEQSARCMDCGVPFCQSNCPLGNIIPEFNDAIYNKNYKRAYDILSRTNPFPEFTGRACPAPCESGCVLGINDNPVTIEMIEKQIIEYAFAYDLVKPNIPIKRTGKNVAVIGSGPAGLAVATQLNQYGHNVTVYEKNDKPGGLLRYGIPDFKLEKIIIDRRIKLLIAEGITFNCGVDVGNGFNSDSLFYDYDAIVLACGCEISREYNVPGLNCNGVNLAMPYLIEHSKRVAIGNDVYTPEDAANPIVAMAKNVVIIGGGDTASDCIGTANRQKATSITQLIRAPRPPKERDLEMPWPTVPHLDILSTSQEEGVTQLFSIGVKEFIQDTNGKLSGVRIVELEKIIHNRKVHYDEVTGSERIIPCDLALIAIGFSNPTFDGLLETLDLELTDNGNIKADDVNYKTSMEKVFATGDVRRGQSLIVWAIKEGRDCAKSVHEFLQIK